MKKNILSIISRGEGERFGFLEKMSTHASKQVKLVTKTLSRRNETLNIFSQTTEQQQQK